MTHDIAVRTVCSLVPDIEKKGAEAVLLDYAEKENLPPAQLEKLAQVFNTLRTIDHVDKHAAAEDRGKAVQLVDVPSLVVDYVSRSTQEKMATPISQRVSSHLPGSVDLMSAVRFDAPVVKAASAPEPVKQRISDETLRDVAFEMAMDAREDMEKLATELLGALPKTAGGLDISDAVSDARHLCNEFALGKSLEWLKSASVIPLIGENLNQPLVKRAFATTGRCGDLLAQFTTAFVTHRAMRKIAAKGSIATMEPGPDSDPADAEPPPMPKSPVDVDAELTRLLSGMSEEERQRFLSDEGIDVPTVPAPDEPTAATPDFVATGGGSGGGNGAGADTSDKKDSEKAKGAPPQQSDRVKQVLKALTSPIRATGNLISETAGKAQSHIDRVTSKERTNRDQMVADLDVEDVRRSIGIRRMIGTDPVLREADPREVLEIYNAVARTNPEIIHNMPALRLLLREAVSYEGLTLDSQKQLTDIRQNASKSEAQEADNLKRRYTISGGSAPKSKA